MNPVGDARSCNTVAGLVAAEAETGGQNGPAASPPAPHAERSLNAPEPPPAESTGPAIWDLVIADMRERDLGGQRKYGTRLRARNGRDALVDLYQELLDAVVYIRQELEERTEPASTASTTSMPEPVARDYLSRCEADTVAGVEDTPACGRNPLRDALDENELAKVKLDEARDTLAAKDQELGRLRTLLHFALLRQANGTRCTHEGEALPGCGMCDPIAAEEARKSPAMQSAGVRR